MIDQYITNCEEIYSVLGDERSKEIYENRVMYSLTGADKYKRRIVKLSGVAKEFIQKMEKYKNKSILVYGAGKRGEYLVNGFDYEYKCFIDKNKNGGNKCNIPIVSLKEALSMFSEPVIIITNELSNMQIKQELINEGVNEENILNLGAMLNHLSEKIYFDLPQLPRSCHEVFADVGGYDGKSSLNFVNWCDKQFDHIYIFEPDSINGMMCRETMNREFQETQFTYINKGVWNKNDIVPFNESGTQGSQIINTGGKMVPVTALDEELRGKRITFIKMDIEGAEFEALQGAEEIIRTQTPKLAISVYHKKSDIFKIPQLIRTFSDRYIFYLRHYTIGPGDTVLYAMHK